MEKGTDYVENRTKRSDGGPAPHQEEISSVGGLGLIWRDGGKMARETTLPLVGGQLVEIKKLVNWPTLVNLGGGMNYVY